MARNARHCRSRNFSVSVRSHLPMKTSLPVSSSRDDAPVRFGAAGALFALIMLGAGAMLYQWGASGSRHRRQRRDADHAAGDRCAGSVGDRAPRSRSAAWFGPEAARTRAGPALPFFARPAGSAGARRKDPALQCGVPPSARLYREDAAGQVAHRSGAPRRLGRNDVGPAPALERRGGGIRRPHAWYYRRISLAVVAHQPGQ